MLFDRGILIVNTFRRLDLLRTFLDYYQQCPQIQTIQVVWSDTVNAPPRDWLADYEEGRVVFEVHDQNSLNNRFRALLPIPTEGVLSTDDDVILPCEDLQHLMETWQVNPRVLVGFSPRIYAYHEDNGLLRYLNWQYTWWTGAYAIMLTKICMLHRDYLADFDKVLPASYTSFVDQSRNGEDLGMAYVVHSKNPAPPVWVSGQIYEIGIEGISSGSAHFDKRSTCLDKLFALNQQGMGLRPWLSFGYQKVVRLDWWTWFSSSFTLFYDNK
eukprot:scaffold5903_cov165-Ochromonas_danica.AAC.2